MALTLLIVVAASCAALATVLAVKTMRFSRSQVPVLPLARAEIVKEDAVRRLSRAIQCETVSRSRGDRNDPAFEELKAHLVQSFPLVYEKLELERVDAHTLLFRWAGTNRAARPIMLMGHTDVVPAAAEASEREWTHPPFSGVVADGFIWGRGAWDNKSAVMGILEAVEILLREGHQPQRDIYLSFGHDEEVHGFDGAAKVAALLQSRGVQFEYLLDEGMIVSSGETYQLKSRIALVGIAEKGALSVRLEAIGEAGHSSMPPVPTVIGRLARAIKALEDTQMESKITPVLEQMLDAIGPEMPLPKRILVANRWLFGGVLKKMFLKTPRMRAFLRTTTAPTIISGGVKENVLPGKATAIVNFRILTGQTVEDVLAHAKKVINDPQVTVTPMADAGNPTEARSVKHPSFTLLSSTIRQLFPDAVVAPSLLVGRTDSRHFEQIADRIYKFSPIVVAPEDLKRFHGVDERISVDDYIEAIQFYRQLILNSSAQS